MGNSYSVPSPIISAIIKALRMPHVKSPALWVQLTDHRYGGVQKDYTRTPTRLTMSSMASVGPKDHINMRILHSGSGPRQLWFQKAWVVGFCVYVAFWAPVKHGNPDSTDFRIFSRLSSPKPNCSARGALDGTNLGFLGSYF